MFFTTSLIYALVAISSVKAHALITAVKGANGVNVPGFGVVDPTGKSVRLFNQSPRIAKGDVCGTQRLDGKTKKQINRAAETTKALSKDLPTIAADGTISMTIFQVNGDGAGPFTCEASTDGTGKNFEPLIVLQNVPGTKGRSAAKNKAFDVKVELPAGMKCTGAKNTCLVRCKNALAQPFGGCLLVQQEAGRKRELIGRYNAARLRRFSKARIARDHPNEDENSHANDLGHS